MIQKELVQSCFDNSAVTYDSVAGIQLESSKFLVNMLGSGLKDVNSILDIGCGTGNTSLELLKKHPNAEFCLCDISSKMLEVAVQKIPKTVSTICCDAENYNFDRNYDLIISNLSMQWFDDILGFIEKIRKHTKTLAFSTLLRGSFEKYRKLLNSPPPFEYIEKNELLESVSQIKNYAINRYCIEFDNFFAVAKYFKKMGAYYSSSNMTEKAKKEKSEFYKRISDINEKITLDFEVFFGILA